MNSKLLSRLKVLYLVISHVHARAHVEARHEAKGEGIAGGGDTVCARAVSAVESAVGRARPRVWAEGRIPLVT
jgi:hypothetical protein